MDLSKLKYHILAFIVVAIWGVTFVSTKVLIGEGLHPSQIFAFRFILAYAGIWILELVTSRGQSIRLWADNWKEELIMLFLGITGGSIYFLTENTALAHTQACNVAFIVCSTPLITVLLTLLCRRLFKGRLREGLEKVTVGWRLIVGTALAFVGMGLIIFEGASFHFSLIGDLLSIAAALCWASYSILMSQMTTDYGTVFVTRKVFFYGLLTIIPFLLLGNYNWDLSIMKNEAVWGNLLFLGVMASLVCFVIWNKVMAKLGNVTSTNYVYLNPFFTLVSAMIFLGEKMTPMSAIGSALLFVGVFMGSNKNK